MKDNWFDTHTIKNPKEYGVLYAQIVLPKGHKLEWLRHCALTSVLPKDLQNEIKKLSSDINNKYKSVIVIPMDNRIAPGCTTKPEAIDEVANAIYEGMSKIFKKLLNEDNRIRLVYTTGEMDSKHIKTCKSTHIIGNFPVMIKVGEYLDSSNKPGIFKI